MRMRRSAMLRQKMRGRSRYQYLGFNKTLLQTHHRASPSVVFPNNILPQNEISVPTSNSALLFSSGKWRNHRQELARGNALRTMRETDGRRSPASNGTANVDYRLRSDGTSPSSDQVSSLWGESEKQEAPARRGGRRRQLQRGDNLSFASFFDEVDAIMEENHGYRNSRKSPGSSLLDKLGEPFGMGIDLTSSATTPKLFREKKSKVASEIQSTTERPPSISSVGTGRKSIFDVLPASVAQPENKNAYERNMYEQYHLLLQDVIERFSTRKGLDEEVIKWLTKSERVVPSNLPIIEEIIRDGGAIPSKGVVSGERVESVALRKQLDRQRELFLDRMPLTPKQLSQARTALKTVADLCAKRARAAPLEIAWEKIKEAGITPSEEAMNTFLYVVSTGGLGLASSISAPLDSFLLSRDSTLNQKGGSILDALKPLKSELSSESEEIHEDANEKRDIKEEVSVFRDILYDPTERSISVRINSLIAKGHPKAAESLLEGFESNGGALRLRTFMPVLKYYCEQGEVACALSLFGRMREISTVYLEPETYILMISTIAENGLFRQVKSICGNCFFSLASMENL
mmetsp:Transcript_57757/g.172392  ORF Transcript_57757/g.172392 Transcript_57757/m.172392 type:complete len:576 (-) Transcript_57757:1283-3010(-)